MAETGARPNVLVIMSDQHTPDVLGAYGNPHAVTPHLDRLAAGGVRFTNAYCNSPICVPSRMSFLSGQTTQQIECWSLSDTMRSDLVTWPVLLGAAGYDTVISGRMHFWWPDKHFGFHRRLCGEAETRIAQGTYDLYEPGPERDRVLNRYTKLFYEEFEQGTPGVGRHRGWDEDHEATDKAVEFIRSRRPGQTPFALCVGFFCPHSPYRAPQEYYDRFRDLPFEPTQLDPALPDFMMTFARNAGADRPLNPETQRRAARAYYAMVNYVDELVGRLVRALQDAALFDNTVILYVADHGEMLGRRGLWYKNQLLEPSIRIPFIAHGPGLARAGAAQESVVSLLDVYPTLAEIAQTPCWPEAAGDSLTPLLQGESAARFADRPVFIEYADFGIGQPAACIRRRNLKLIAVRSYESVLYDLDKDPRETRNVAKDPAYAAALKQLQADLARYWDPEDTWRRVIRNQKRLELIRRSRNAAIERAGGVEGLGFGR